MIICIVLLAWASVAMAGKHLGVDLSLPLSNISWKSLKENRNIEFAVVRIYNDNATIVPQAANNLINAWEAGIEYLSVYMFPCIDGSRYSRDNNIICPTAEEQFMEILDYLENNAITMRGHHTGALPHDFSPTRKPTASPTAKPTRSPAAGPSPPTQSPTFSPTQSPTLNPSASPTVAPTPTQMGPTLPPGIPTRTPTATPLYTPTVYPTNTPGRTAIVNTIYINIEDDNPARYFHSNTTKNVEYLVEFMNSAYDYGLEVGVYTTARDWSQTMGSQLADADHNMFASVPLWTPRYDRVDSFDFYVPFAGWNLLHIKQTQCGPTSLRRSGSNRICTNYIEALANETTVTVLGPYFS